MMADETSDLGGLRTGAHLAVHEVIAYRAGELADGAERAVEDHLSRCLECRRLVHTARRVLGEVGTTVKDASTRANQVDLLLARLRQRAEARIARPQGWVQREP